MYLLPRFLSTRPSRALIETLLVGVISWLFLLILRNHLFPSFLRPGIYILIGVVSIFVCALRLRIPKGTLQRQVLLEVAIASVLSLVLSAMGLISLLVLWGYSDKALLVATFAFVLNCVVFVILRFVIRLGLFWDR